MSDRSPYLAILLRAAIFVFAPIALMLGLPAAIALWPESEYVRIWEISYGILALLSFIAFFATRRMRKK